MAAATEKHMFVDSQSIQGIFERLKNLSRSSATKDELNSILDYLNAKYYVQVSEKYETELILCDLTRLISHDQELLVTKLCHLIGAVIKKCQQNMNENCIKTLTAYLFGCSEHCSNWIVSDILFALSEILYRYNSFIQEYLGKFTGENGFLTRFCSAECKNYEQQLIAVKCIESITEKMTAEVLNQEYLKSCFSMLLAVVVRPKPENVDNLIHSKIIMCSLKGIQNVLIIYKSVHVEQLGLLLAVLKVYIFHGLPGQNMSTITSLYPTPLSQHLPTIVSKTNSDENVNHNKTPKSQGKKNRKKRLNQKKKKDESDSSSSTNRFVSRSDGLLLHDEASFYPTWSKISSSESEYSDTEGGHAAKLNSVQIKVRQSAFCTLLTVVKITDKKLIFGYWSSFLPDSPSSGNAVLMQTPTISLSVLKDSSPKVRIGAISVICAMVESAKQYLFLADDRQQHRTSFTSFSMTIASMIKELHRCLVLAILVENSPQTLTQLVKCVSVLVSCVPYHKLASGLVQKVAHNVKPLLMHRDQSVQVASLSVMSSLASIEPHSKEIIASLTDTSNVNSSSVEVSEGEPWLLKVCVDIINSRYVGRSNIDKQTDQLGRDNASPVELESLQVLSVLVSNHFSLLRLHIDILVDLICWCAQHSDTSIKLHGAKLLKATGKSFLSEVNKDSMEKYPEINSLAFKFWMSSLNGPLPNIMQSSDDKVLQAVGCDCLSDVGGSVFSELPLDKRMMCVTLVLGLANDFNPNLKAAAIRTLGMFVSYPLLKEDTLFLADVADIVMSAMSDSQSVVRIKTAWSLGNLTDALLCNKECNHDFNVIDELLPMSTILKLCQMCIEASNDSDMVKCNSIRGLGNLLRFLPESAIDLPEIAEISTKSIVCLAASVSNGADKVRWNTCYAVGNLFKNYQLMEKQHMSMEPLFRALMTTMKSCRNYKVRINAVTALCVPESRHHYYPPDLTYPELWKSSIESLESLENITDFSEYKHMENLKDQIIKCLLHLISLAVILDLGVIYECVGQNTENMSEVFSKFIAKTNVDCTGSEILEARENLKRLADGHENSEEKLCIWTLLQMLQDPTQNVNKIGPD